MDILKAAFGRINKATRYKRVYSSFGKIVIILFRKAFKLSLKNFFSLKITLRVVIIFPV